jgi:DNA segregation ATPase FtsK/SpoIIIE-like protein
MLTNVLAKTVSTPHDQPDFFLSEHLSDTARLHHERTYFDAVRYREAVREVRRLQIASVDFLRRQLRLDYPQALAFVQHMEAEGIIRRTAHRSREARRGWRYEVVS